MMVVGVIVGVIAAAILIMHTFLTNNALEKACDELREDVNNYYVKSEENEQQI